MHQMSVSFQDPFVETQPPVCPAGLWEEVRSRAWRHLNGPHALVGRELVLALFGPPCASIRSGQSETWRRALTGTQPGRHLDLGRAASRIPAVY